MKNTKCNDNKKLVNTIELNDTDTDKVNGGWVNDPDAITYFTKDGRLKPYYFITFGVEVEKYWWRPNIYRINGKEVTAEEAHWYCHAKLFETLNKIQGSK